jgi:ATP-dependent DNA helicase DinG
MGARGGHPKGRREGAPDAIFASDGPLADRKREYQYRPEQVELARAVERTFRERGVLLADAPTGTGKSASYLAPAILRALRAGEKVLISTATLALQNQLLSEDVPVISGAASALLGQPEEEGISYAVMKGRRNFLCGQRHEETLREGTLLDTKLVTGLDRWAVETETGDREDLTFPVPAWTWLEVASDGEDCAPKGCRFREGCFYYAHREKAQDADIVIVNHALLMANVTSGGNIFDAEGRSLIIDEAHLLEDVMSEALGARVSYGRVRYAMRQAKKKSEGATAHADRAEMAAELFFAELEANGTLGKEESAPGTYRTLKEALISVSEVLSNDPKEEANNLAGLVARLLGDLRFFYSRPEEEYAYTVVEGRRSFRRGRKGGVTGEPLPELKSWLVDTGKAFREGLLPLFGDGGVVLTSATLATGSGQRRSFAYTKGRLGLDEALKDDRPVREHLGAEVFDYASRCLLYVEEGQATPSDGPANIPARDREAAAGAKRAEELVKLSGGRALVLLSTSRAVEAYRSSFAPPFPVRFQGDDSPGRLVRWLKETEGGVLVGTRSFWTGVDVPGEAVSLVIIDRVPFPVPDDPVIKRLSERAGREWFRAVSLPRAQVALRQGAGRLMRRDTDRGVIALLDPRIRRKGWGKSVLSSLPPAPVTGSLREVEDFFQRGPSPAE